MRFFFTATCFCLLCAIVYAQPKIDTTSLQTEYLHTPLALDEPAPRFTWKWAAGETGSQSAYSIEVATDASFQEQSIVWRSGDVRASSQLARYAGQPLRPFTTYYWKLVLTDQKAQRSEAAITQFETGMMQSSNWKGSWISDVDDVHLKPAGMFRQTFRLSRAVRSARVYIAVAGLYELSINGKRIGNHRLDPMYTRFDRRTLYVGYDVTAALQAGDNAIGVLLGNGWYNHQSTAVWFFDRAPWRGRPAFCLDLHVQYDDGSTEIISTNKTWKTSLSEIQFNSIYTAEHVDNRRLQKGWNRAGFVDTAWKPVLLRAAPAEKIVSQAMVPIEWVDTIPAVSARKINDTVWLFDIGRNIAGVSQMTVSGKAGTVLRLKHAERLNAAGRADQSNIDVHYRPTDDTDPFQTDIYSLAGDGPETFYPRFNYKGFQYVEVQSSEPLQLTKENLVAYFMHSAVPPVGRLQSSNTLLNKIWSATNNSYLSNLFGYPTDCPQREKNGWTGDAHIAIETGLYNFDGITVYEKWLADHRDEQQPNGVLPSIIPTGGWGYEWGNGPDWTSSIAIIPWQIYLFYGDSSLLSRSYDAMKKYVDHIADISPSGLTTWGLGDWIPVKSKSPVELTSTAYYFKELVIVAKAAAILGHQEEARHYQALAEKVKKAYNKKYFNEGSAIYGSGFQTELSISLAHGLVPEQYRLAVADNLAKAVQANGGKLDVGLLGTKAILNALSENGHAATAWQLASTDQYPSWGYWISHGATSLYENWPIDAASDISMNHIMFGEIGAWMYKGLAGIFPDEQSPGFERILLRPHFVKGLAAFEASHDGPRGRIYSGWKTVKGKLVYKAVVPPNSSAFLQLEVPVNGKKEFELGPGEHRFTLPVSK